MLSSTAIALSLLIAQSGSWSDLSDDPLFSSPEEEENQPDPSLFYEQGGLGTGFTMGLKVGAAIPLELSEFGLKPAFELELGFLLPMWQRRLGVFAGAQFVSPSRTGVLQDTGLQGDPSYAANIDQLMVSGGMIYRLPIVQQFRPYLVLGGRMYFLNTRVSVTAGGQDFSKTEEGTTPGVFGGIGTEFYLDPGAFTLEVQSGWAPLNGDLIDDSSTLNLVISLGYRIFL